ncbi:MAG: GAF domain-containing protein [Sphingomonadaceae bacterium]
MTGQNELLRRQEVLAKFGDFILDCDDLQAILTEGCRLISDALGTDLAKVLEIEPDGTTALVRAGIGWKSNIVGVERIRLDERSSEAFAIQNCEPLITNNIETDDRFEFPQFMRDEGVKALVNVPIFLPGRVPYGLLQVDALTERSFGTEEIEFLRTYAMVLGPVIDRLRKLVDLRKATEQNRIIVENARNYAIFLMNEKGCITAWTKGAQSVFGWEASEVLGRKVDFLFTQEDQDKGKPALEISKAAKAGRAADLRWHVTKDGRHVFIDGQTIALRGDADGFMKIGQDVTERQMAEEALKESRARTDRNLVAMQQLQEVSLSLVGDHAPPEPYQRIAAAAKALMKADGAAIQLLDDDTEMLQLEASAGIAADTLPIWHLVSASRGSAWDRALKTGQSVLVADAVSDASDADEHRLYNQAGIGAVLVIPLQSPRGALVGVIAISWQCPHAPDPDDMRFVDVLARLSADLVERLDAASDLRRSEERLRSAVEVGHLGLWDWNVRTGKVHWSDEHFRMEGYDVGEITPSYEAWLARVHPEDRASAESALRKAMDHHQEFEHEFRALHPDGTIRWLHGRGCFFYDQASRPQRMIGAMIDITARREWETRQNILIGELQHRTRNLIGVVQGMASTTAGSTRSVEEFYSRFSERLQALARVQGVLSRLHEDERVSFDELLRNELGAMSAPMDRVTLSGPKGVRLRSSTVQTLALALHELATNAAKYGAFRYVGASLQVDWTLVTEPQARANQLTIVWRERGVPLTRNGAQRMGQGRDLIENALPYQLKASTSFAFENDGVKCSICLPVSTKAIQS